MQTYPLSISNHFKTFIVHSILIVISLLSLQAHSKSMPRYNIEVMVFEHYNPKGWTEEHWSDEILLPITEHNSTPYNSTGVKPLYIKQQSLSLQDAALKMKRGYQILFHQAWSQTIFNTPDAPTVLIKNDRPYAADLLGTVKFYKTRYAHIEVNLVLKKFIPKKYRAAFAKNQQLTEEELPSHWHFIINEARKIKSNQLHYIDHPLFGVLIQISRIKSPTVESLDITKQKNNKTNKIKP